MIKNLYTLRGEKEGESSGLKPWGYTLKKQQLMGEYQRMLGPTKAAEKRIKTKEGHPIGQEALKAGAE